MKILSVFALLCVLFLPSIVRADGEFPKRKVGLWEMQVSSGSTNQSMKQCIDEATDAKLQQMGSQIGQGCSNPIMHNDGKVFSLEIECKMMGSKIHSKSTFTGDFNSKYQGVVVSTYDPPMMGLREMNTKIAARWLGPCEKGQQPGDMIMSNGTKMNLETLNKMAQMGGRH